jgi:PIN domain nuclease of toxin-antitoxin system
VNVLLDTSGLLWWLADSDRLGRRARGVLADPCNRVYVSAASAWEIAIKLGLRKLAVTPGAADWLPAQLAANRFLPLPISLEHALAVERLPRYHADPFDRLLIAQAMTDDLTVVTADAQFERYDVRVIRC